MGFIKIDPYAPRRTPRLLGAAFGPSLSRGGGGGTNITHLLSPKAMDLGFERPLNHFLLALSTFLRSLCQLFAKRTGMNSPRQSSRPSLAVWPVLMRATP